MQRRMRPFTAWIALLALTLAALAPALSSALAQGAAPAWTEICRGAGDEPAPAGGHTLDHCPYCGTQAPPLALPPAGGTTVALPPLTHRRPQGAAVTAAALPPWQLAAARAPPAVA